MKRIGIFSVLLFLLLLSVPQLLAQSAFWQQMNGLLWDATVVNPADGCVMWNEIFEGDVCVLFTDQWASVGARATNAQDSNGVFRSLLTTDMQENPSEIPRAFLLAQNYPNPFNPSTNIKYSLPQAIDVQLAIFDFTGRCVRTLVQQPQSAGQYDVTWDGRDDQGEPVSSGLYNYQLRAGTFVQARRMALVR